MPNLKGKIQTVLGLIPAEDAGIVLPHEHLTCNAGALMKKEPPVCAPELCKKPLTPDIGWWLLQHPYSSFDNSRLYEEQDAVVKEMHFFKSNGGSTIVDNTTLGIKRDIIFLEQLAKETSVHIVAGTGYYVEPSRPETVSTGTEEMASYMRKELQEGCDGTKIKAGVIGEIGCSWPLTASEKTSIQASAHVQAALRCPVIIHPGRDVEAPFEIVRVYQEAGGNVDKLIMSHIDRTIYDVPKLLEFAELGCYVEYDLFGQETSHYQLAEHLDMPSDAQRIQMIKALIDAGYEDRVTIAHDIHTKHRLMKYGGHGYSHILLNVAPKMLKRGISQQAVDKILHSNPQTWLAYT